MLKKIVSYGIVGLLAVALIAGTGYILLRPAEAQEQGSQQGGQLGNEIWRYDQDRGQGRGNGERGVGTGNRGTGGQGQGSGETASVAWRTLTGQVTAVDQDVTVQTPEGEVLVGMGQSAYWQDFELAVGDEVTLRGFYEDGEFKAGTVENVTNGKTLMLRDESGHPLWASRGERKNQRVLSN